MHTWMYLNDMAPQAHILNLESGEIRTIMSSAVKDRAPAGLRRYLLEELSGGTYRETGYVVPMTAEVHDDLVDFYHAPNSWNYDWPHLQIEQDEGRREQIVSRLSTMMQGHPYDFQVTGIQRRYLMYYSDGSIETQQRFERYIPNPKAFPYRHDGSLRRKYTSIYNNIMRDAGVPYKPLPEFMGQSCRPCLYLGPAWVVRFTLDGHDPLLERCRVYVDDEANFICSDWCQRHDYSSYNNGINLQTGIYSFDGWVTGPCVIRNIDQGWRPKSVTVQRSAVRELLKTAPPPVPEFNGLLIKAKAMVAKANPNPNPAAHTLAPAAGPITADAMAEALAAAEQIWQAKQAAATTDTVPASSSPEPSTPQAEPTPPATETVWDRWSLQAFKSRSDNYYLVAFNERDYEDAEGTRYVAARFIRVDQKNQLETFDIEVLKAEAALLLPSRDDTACQGFAFVNDAAYFVSDSTDTIGAEPLNDHWWMWDAAWYHQSTVLQPTAVSAVLLEGNEA